MCPPRTRTIVRDPIRRCELGAVGDSVSSREGDEADKEGIYFSLLRIVHWGELSMVYITV